MRFTKMQGLGNDYVYINCFEERVDNPSELAVRMSNRHFGIGSDGLVLIMPSELSDFRMRMFNADGSESEMCGNATRCIGKYVYEKGLTSKNRITLETLAGEKQLTLHTEEGQVKSVTVDMGEPVLEAAQIPVNSNKTPVIGETIQIENSRFAMTCVSMGNPHGVLFVDNLENYPVIEMGPKFELHEKFPKRVNAEFVQVLDRKTLKMRVWERGSGETLACGTGACATLVAAVLNDKTDRKATVKLLGGDLIIEWDENTNHVLMTGPAAFVFEGVWEQA